MAKKKVGVIAECVCDLPHSIISEYDIDIVYFLIQTDTGVFTDTDEITAENMIGYMEAGGKKSKSSAPSVEVYIQAFKRKLENYEEVFLPTIGSAISDSYANATKAAGEMGDEGKHVHIFDTGHLSTGLGHMVICAAQLAKSGEGTEKITAALSDLQGRVSTSFITRNTDYLYRNGLVSKTVKKLCGAFSAHPVLAMKNGNLTAETIKFGNYGKSCMRYIRRQLRKSVNIDKTRAFITYAGVPSKHIEQIKEQVAKLGGFQEIIVTKASATVSSNCGPGTVGILFIRNDYSVRSSGAIFKK